MVWRVFGALFFASWAGLVNLCADRAIAVELTPLQQQYAAAFEVILGRWQTRDLVLEKPPASEFEKYVDLLKERQDNGDRLDLLVPAEFVQGNYAIVPEKLEPILPLSSGAQYLLLGGIIDAAPRLEEVGIEPDVDSLMQRLSVPLYFTMAAAQGSAQEEKKEAIDSVSVRRGGVWFFSLGWPFCCATP